MQDRPRSGKYRRADRYAPGVSVSTILRDSPSSLPCARTPSVTTKPGLMELTRIFRETNSLARDCCAAFGYLREPLWMVELGRGAKLTQPRYGSPPGKSG